MSEWQLKIQDPSGEYRRVPISGVVTMGRQESCGIYLKDALSPKEAITLWPTSSDSRSPYWFKVPEGGSPVSLGDLQVREAQLPLGVPLQIGETRCVLECSAEARSSEKLMPSFPLGARPWMTCTEAGRKVLWMAKKAATTPLSVYLEGETGIGKEVLAHLIHAWSHRKSGSFVPIHCGALPLSLAESELFGHVKGAFTGAVQHRPGALMQAHGGTLFLDEVGDLPLDIQVKLLRFLENGEIRPVGADRPSRADVRLVCATHLPLHQLVEEGKFRQDLYYRIASITLPIPTLRSRPEDIELLTRKFTSDLGRTLTPKALLRLKAYPWKGNVRELRHAIERACGFAGDLSTLLGEDAFEFLFEENPMNLESLTAKEVPALSLHEVERLALLKALQLAEGHRSRAANILGVARSTLFEMLKRHRIPGPRSVRSK